MGFKASYKTFFKEDNPDNVNTSRFFKSNLDWKAGKNLGKNVRRYLDTKIELTLKCKH